MRAARAAIASCPIQAAFQLDNGCTAGPVATARASRPPDWDAITEPDAGSSTHRITTPSGATATITC